MALNHSKQSKAAKQFATANNCYGCRFNCCWYRLCVFEIIHAPGILVDPTWPPTYIIVDEQMNARWSTEDEGASIEIASRETKHPWGMAIFEEYEHTRCCDSYRSQIVGACSEYSYDVPIKKELMYKALEEAEMTGKKIKIVPNDEYLPGGSRHEQCDGWAYHIELE